MAKYIEGTCYWCEGPLPIIAGRKRSFSSFSTDTLSTSRDFCTEAHCMAFLTYCKANKLGVGMHYRLPPYWGAKIERMAKKGKIPKPPTPRTPKTSHSILPTPCEKAIPPPAPVPPQERTYSSSFPQELREPWTKERQDEFIARITKKEK